MNAYHRAANVIVLPYRAITTTGVLRYAHSSSDPQSEGRWEGTRGAGPEHGTPQSWGERRLRSRQGIHGWSGWHRLALSSSPCRQRRCPSPRGCLGHAGISHSRAERHERSSGSCEGRADALGREAWWPRPRVPNRKGYPAGGAHMTDREGSATP